MEESDKKLLNGNASNGQVVVVPIKNHNDVDKNNAEKTEIRLNGGAEKELSNGNA